MKLQNLKDIKTYEMGCCKICGNPVNESDGWCFACSDTPKTVTEKMIKLSDLKNGVSGWIDLYNWNLYADEEYSDENEMAREVFNEPFLCIQDYDFLRSWIQYFFNIKESDLE